MTVAAPSTAAATLAMEEPSRGQVIIKLAGRLDSRSTGPLWRPAHAYLDAHSRNKFSLIIDASGVEYCDGTGIGFIISLYRHQKRLGGTSDIRGLREEFQHLLEMYRPDDLEQPEEREPELKSFAVEVGLTTMGLWKDTHELVWFVGELGAAIIYAIRHPKKIRWLDAWKTAEIVGVNALPIVLLIGFLMGLIMAFQSAIPMAQFGAEIFVANLVGLSMLRELGPLMTAIVLAGRSGSAFAAEIGTMKINEEIDALTTMGLEPVRFLVVTRVLAAVVVTPLLSIFANLAGLIGGAVVLMSMGYPLVTYVNQLRMSVNLSDAAGGILKAFVFGILVAGIGCLRGLQTESGSSAVGASTTSAVVSSIIFIAITDSIFSVVFYYLGI